MMVPTLKRKHREGAKFWEKYYLVLVYLKSGFEGQAAGGVTVIPNF